jgi:hypothetical protein
MKASPTSPLGNLVTRALLGAVAGAAAYLFAHGRWDSEGWLAALVAALIGILIQRRNRYA